ncbi:MAG: sugar ABC transporter substrate-binding protein [Planctomycetota bacterium]|nr:MAG: sugar ABC transporter substrate-binding protein [Planctomycetota bacterium]
MFKSSVWVVALWAAVCAACSEAAPANEEPARERVVLGLVGKSQSNPVFQAAYTGAKAAAAELGAQRGIDVVIDWQTPPDEDPAAQAAALEQLARRGVRGIAVSVSEANTLRPAIDKAVELGAQVVCFDSDAPGSARFAFLGTDDIACGRQVGSELAAALGGVGTVAILAGNQAAPNLAARVEGVRASLAEHEGLNLLDDGIYYHAETPEQAAETVARAQSTHPEIDGWAFVGGWPLYTRGSLRWEPGAVKVVSVDALPAQLSYLESGHVNVLLEQDCFAWGYRSVELLLARVLDGEVPAEGPRLTMPLREIRAAQVPEVLARWEAWRGDR